MLILTLAAHLAFAPPAGMAPAVQPQRPVPPPAKAAGYAGHGADSVTPEVLARFRAAPIAPEMSRKVQAMLDVRSPSAGVLSPDGKRLFFGWAVTGTRQVWRLDAPMGFPVQMTGGEDRTDVVDITPDGRTLVLQRDQKGEENPGIYLQSADGGPLQVVQHIPKVQSQALFISDDGKALYFRSNDQKQETYAIYRYDFASKQRTLVFDGSGKDQGGPSLWLAIDQRPGFLLMGKEVGSNMLEVYELDEKTQVLTPLFGQGEREDYAPAYGRGDDVLVLTPKLGEYRRLTRFDRKNKSFVPISPELKWDIEDFSVDRARTRITASVNEGGYTRPRVFDAKSYKEARLPTLPAGDHVLWANTTRDGRYSSVMVDPGTAPQHSYVLDWRSNKLVAWHVPSAPEVDLTSFATTTLESYPARDGAAIPVLVRRPAKCNAPNSGCPVIVDFHGGPEAQARAGFSSRAQLFVDAGFVWAQPNVRGSDGYGKTWLHADDGAKRKAVITDIEDAAIHARKAWGANKVGIFGGSYGGYSVLMGMTYFAGAYDAGVEVVGISSLVTFLENTAPYRRALRISEYGDPVADRAVLTELSPITHVQKTKGAMLLIQGATDPRVPVGEAIQMYEALDKKGLKPQMIVFPDEGHGVQKRENSVLLLGHALAFFDKQLR